MSFKKGISGLTLAMLALSSVALAGCGVLDAQPAQPRIIGSHPLIMIEDVQIDEDNVITIRGRHDDLHSIVLYGASRDLVFGGINNVLPSRTEFLLTWEGFEDDPDRAGGYHLTLGTMIGGDAGSVEIDIDLDKRRATEIRYPDVAVEVAMESPVLSIDKIDIVPGQGITIRGNTRYEDNIEDSVGLGFTMKHTPSGDTHDTERAAVTANGDFVFSWSAGPEGIQPGVYRLSTGFFEEGKTLVLNVDLYNGDVLEEKFITVTHSPE